MKTGQKKNLFNQPLKLVKMQATGNDFLLVTTPMDPGVRADAARRYCDRNYGFGADGFLVIEKVKSEYVWDFYNSDGSAASMCGNAARAVGLFLCEQDGIAELTIQTRVGPLHARRLGPNDVQVQFQLPDREIEPLAYHQAHLVDSGVPHVVLKAADLKLRQTLFRIGQEIKAKFTATGINVTFYLAKSHSAIEAVTFERGVEGFTLSCGTGALAAARVHLNGQDGSCEVQVPGGILDVTFAGKTAILRGEAQLVGWCIPNDSQY